MNVTPEIRRRVREFVEREARHRHPGSAPVEFSEQDPLYTRLGLDSLFFIDLILFLETDFGVKVSPSLRKENFGTLQQIYELLAAL